MINNSKPTGLYDPTLEEIKKMGREEEKLYIYPDELIVYCEFNVLGAEYYKSGVVNLDVKPKNAAIPIKTLIFQGTAFVQKGDRVIAYIEKSEKVETPKFIRFRERSFREQETVSRLEKISENGEVLASFSE